MKNLILALALLGAGSAFAGNGEVGSVGSMQFSYDKKHNDLEVRSTAKDYGLIERITSKLNTQTCRHKNGESARGEIVGRRDQINSVTVADGKITMIMQSFDEYGPGLVPVYEDPTQVLITLSNDQSKVVTVEFVELTVKKVVSPSSLLQESSDKVTLVAKPKAARVLITCK